MRQLRDSMVAVMFGVGALGVFAAPSLAASDQAAGTAKPPAQMAHMGQGQGQGMMQHGMGGQGMMGQGMPGKGMMSPGAKQPRMGAQRKMGPGMGQGMMGRGMHGQGMMGQGMHGQGMMGRGMHGQGMMGQGMHGQGMMGRGMHGQGMMQPGSGCPGGMASGRSDRVVASTHLSEDDVRHFLEHRLERGGNKRLKVGEVKQQDDDKIVADITTVDGSLVQRFEVDRHTGKMQQVE